MQAGSFYLFHQNIKPMWEDKANEGGGRFNIKMKKGYVNKIWEDLIVGFIGEMCEEKDLLNGFVL
jgi:translation initiation factor 4E